MSKSKLGIIGGSGVYNLPELSGAKWHDIATPWGAPSDALLEGEIDGLPLVFLPRHGRGHAVGPSDINYRANIDALKRVGCTHLVSLSACGSLREDLPPGTFVLVDQFIDRTFKREKSFFGPGCVGHVSMAHPVSPTLVERLEKAAQEAKIPHSRGGTYLAMEGPQFSTLAESRLYRQWGCDVIGMTNMPEAKLAREAELPYATVAMVTDFDSWHPAHGEVDVRQIIAQITDNVEKARKLILTLISDFPREAEPCAGGSDKALEFAILTAPENRDPELMKKLDAVASRVLSR
ncbi:hypothetical protein CAPTEDRAFT_129038 [Capitella teleta]|uniref:S-methyl-5'-thioadenosine phosphorylase n=1 Tax=Capitella teleta TaxID=283909 RepID=R7TK99_CAPTE|nr:hypothetical protein CAPTEDRAFT_129038 [Capitella teleta]|eukprot:ELT91540.1 hypothetical protein CAPTEDRAFT_129038 [Capitella teleta]